MSINREAAKRYLSSHGWPNGMQDTILKSFDNYPIRFFLVDDSGSMASNDGHRLLRTENGAKMVNSSRWGELKDTVLFHAGLAYAAESPMEIRLLNEYHPFMIGESDDPGEYNRLIKALDKSPGGSTPLCAQISSIIGQIEQIADSLRRNGHKAVIIIATDGESSDGDIASAMKPLERLPVWVVIRLCTDEENVVQYWNNIDSQLELDMDVLDDMAGEADEIFEQGNTWLTYAEPLHRLREFGSPIREMDLMDEKCLTAEQARAVCCAIFGGELRDYPHPDEDWSGFCRCIQAKNKAEARVYNPRKKAMMPWIHEHNFSSQFSQESCSIM